MLIELDAALSWLGAALAGGWIASFFALRKDERAIQIRQITEERAKWRNQMRELAGEIAVAWIEQQKSPNHAAVEGLRARLATSINPKDDVHDLAILKHFDGLFFGESSDIAIFSKRIALLLKHDWERVKWDCAPLYAKPLIRFTPRQRAWRRSTYRNIQNETSVAQAELSDRPVRVR